MAAVVTVAGTEPLGERNLYWGTIALDASYPTGGEALDVSGNESFDIVLCTHNGGYSFDFVKSSQKLIAYYADNNNASDGPQIQVPDTTDLSAITAIPFIAIGQ